MTIANRIKKIQDRIQSSARLYHREGADITLLAVSKGQSALAVKQAFQAGITQFGENYLQEALLKIQTLQNLPVSWHFIGPIQSNKAQKIAENFNWVHSLSQEKSALLFDAFRSQNPLKLNVCLQVNLDREASKSGVLPEDLPKLALLVSKLPNLQLRGLMAIPKIQHEEKEQYASFLRLTSLLKQLNSHLDLKMDTLSMGMSEDFIPAIRAGSTIVRIGQAIFGERT